MLKLKKYKFLLLLGVIIITILLINDSSANWVTNLSINLDEARKAYIGAKKMQDNNDFKNAYYEYNKVPEGYPAYDIVLYQQSICAEKIEDEKTSIEKLKTLISKYPDSPIAPKAAYNLGRAYVRVGEKDKAEEQFLDLIKRYPETEFATGSKYFLGEINKTKNPKTAVKYWHEYLKKSPDGKFASECASGIKANEGNLSIELKKAAGIGFYHSRRYDEAFNHLRQVPLQESWLYLGKINEAFRNPKALYYYKHGLQYYADSFTDDEVREAMQSYVRLSSSPASDSWSELANIAGKCKDFALYKKAQLLPKSEALQLYHRITNNYPEGKYSSEALWNVFWNEYSSGRYSKAIEFGQKHVDRYSNMLASPKIIFWTAKAYERSGDNHSAIKYYNKVLDMYPDSYYAFRADGRLKNLKGGIDPEWNTNPSTSFGDLASAEKNPPYSYDDVAHNHSIQIAEMLGVNDLNTASELMGKDPFIDSWIKLQQGITSKSIVASRDGMDKLMPKPNPSDRRWQLIYPLYYLKEVEQYSKANSLDPVIVLSLMREESYFNPLAVSSSNARGLMQLLPGTARDVVRWNNFGGITDLQLFHQTTNIKLGTAYLRYAKERLNNSTMFAVAGYNGGPGAIERWLRTSPSSDMDQFIENIPYDQTRDYVKKVYRSYWNYKRIYNIE